DRRGSGAAVRYGLSTNDPTGHFARETRKSGTPNWEDAGLRSSRGVRGTLDGRRAQEALLGGLGQDPPQDRCGRAEGGGEGGDEIVRDADGERGHPQKRGAEYGLGPRLPSGRSSLVVLGGQGP